MTQKRSSILILLLLCLPVLVFVLNYSKFANKNAIPLCFQYVFANDLEQLKRNAETCARFQTETHVTTLMMAASKGQPDMVTLLLEKGADPDLQNEMGHSALAFAVIKNKKDVVQVLMNHGAKIVSDTSGISIVMMAIQFGRADLLKILNPSEHDVNLKADDGWTALYFTIRNQNMEVLRYLLTKGACTNVIDTYSQSPLDFAMENQWSASYKILKRARPCDAITANQ